MAKNLIQCSNEGEYSVYQYHFNGLEDGVHVSLVNGYCLKLDKRLREHLEDWIRQWELCFLPEVDRPVDFAFNDDRREVVLS